MTRTNEKRSIFKKMYCIEFNYLLLLYLCICRAKTWRQNLRNGALDSLSMPEIRKLRVCSKHFRDNQYSCSAARHEPATRLKWNAIPTVIDCPNPPTSPTPKRKRPAARSNVTFVSRKKTKLLTVSGDDGGDNGGEDGGNDDDVTGGDDGSDNGREDGGSDDDSVSDIKRTAEIATQTSGLNDRKKFASNAQRCITRLRNQVCYWKRRCGVVEKSRLTTKDSSANVLMKMHSKKSVASNKFAVRWSPNEIELGLAIYHKSPAAYRFIREDLNVGLPAVSSLKTRTRNIMQRTGPCPTILASINQMLSHMSSMDKIATLSIDGMHLTSSLRYEAHLDHFTGFEDVGSQGRTTKVADEGLVAMLRGVHSNWKQPIAHYFCNHSVKQDRFWGIVLENLRAAHDIGVTVVALVCDQETTQWALLKKLISIEKPYFDHPVTGTPVYVIIDVPHCLKNARNCIMKYDIEFDSGK